MTTSHPRPDVAIVRNGVIAVLLASGNVVAAGWSSMPSSSDLVTVESLGPAALMTHADGAWVLYSPALSVDCAPPRGCYAKTQRIHYDFRCSPGYAVITERISMDLGGNVIKHEVLDSTTAYSPSYDAGAVRVLVTFCKIRDRD
jgi:hypothetical protein